MQAYVDQLNDIFKDKKSLYNEIHRSWRHYQNQNYVKPTTVFTKLIELGYDFTQEDFNHFITCSVYNKTNGFITWAPYNDPDKKTKATIVKALFTKFTPTDKQIKMLLCCFGKYNNNYEWVDVLIEKGYEFTEANKKILIDSGYDTTKLLKDNVTLDDIKNTITALLVKKSTTIDNLTKILDKFNALIPNEVIELAIKSYKYNDTYYYDATQDILFQVLHKLVKKGCTLDNNINSIIIKNEWVSTFAFYELFNLGLQPNDELKEYLLSKPRLYEVFLYLNKFEPKYQVDKNILIPKKSTKQTSKYTVNDMNKLLSNRLYLQGIYTKSQYNHVSQEKIRIHPFLFSVGFDEDLINECGDSNGLNLYKFMTRAFDIIPNIETLRISCVMGYNDVFRELTSKYKLQPTKEILDETLTKTHNQEIISSILCYKIIPDSLSIEALLNYWSDEIFQLLVKFSLKLTLSDLGKIMEQHHLIENLERFSIKYDDKLYYQCYLNNFFPDEYVSKFTINKDVLNLRNICRNPASTQEDFVAASSNVQIDRYCYDHACAHNSSIQEYLESLNYKPTLGSLHWFNKHQIIDKFKRYATVYGIDKTYMESELEIMKS
ncbi:hypothetical protein QKU48_gp0197 [Fadolivirus algeromassiliense]|jgi:hypothetical protein|uniref:Uncharacterized protein n=1 Tax=Fadolivirus FV1/VV64 TaxID=3070911 RepID=A0A7D3V581_9VIRU|nr:hypothetical protein QKU48_gp0197 [Fadolivirus algeromassiliense]QKF93655.1 hypothetical protein Fadolivirus_1_197 [Fadolivirus FV1/VV64]